MLRVLRTVATHEGVTIVMTSHDPMALEQTDRVVELVDGRVA
jgi:ABC-type lipoprotein export system ATPase subunit